MLTEKIQHRLIMALAMAESEIHNPGRWRSEGVDIASLIAAVLKEADRNGLALKAVREQLKKDFAA